MFPKYFVIGAISAALAIAFGAFGAHGLEGRISEHYLSVFETGVRYHMYAALGLMIIAMLDMKLKDSKLALNGARLIAAGMIIFSGSLYVLSLTSISILGAITPIGGVAMIGGWICIAIAAIRYNRI